MYVMVIRGKNEYIAVAKDKPFSSEKPDLFLEPDDLWFDFGSTQEKALGNLKKSLIVDGKDINAGDGGGEKDCKWPVK